MKPYQTLFAALLLACSVAHADLTVLPGAPVTADGKTRMDLVVLNETGQTQWYVPAPTITVRVAGKPVELKLAGSEEQKELRKGEFLRVPYAVAQTLPEHAVVEVVPALPAKGSSPSKPEKAPSDLTRAITDDNYQQEAGLVEYLSYRLRPYEPMYFLVGTEQPNAKFQLSFKYQLFGNQSDDPRGVFSPLSGLFLAYSQTSFWDLEGESKPFFDNSYRPEVFFTVDRLDERWKDQNDQRIMPDWMKFGFQVGLKHESNGRDGDDSRSLNIVYLRPILTLTNDKYFVTFAPSVHAYVLGMDETNENIEEYRGFGDFRMTLGEHGGVQLAAIARAGEDFDKGSLQLDLSFPIRKLTGDYFDIYFHAQYFTGYGESLLNFDQQDSSVRFGISMVR